MSDLQYCRPKLNEFIDILFVTLVLGFLFSFTFAAHDGSQEWFGTFLAFAIFILIMFLFKNVLMKYMAMKNGFEYIFKQGYFDRYWFRKYDRLSHIEGEVREKVIGVPQEVMSKLSKKSEDYVYETDKQIRGIPTAILSIVIFILTLGFIVYPNMWRFACKRIPHLHIGTQKSYEVSDQVTFYPIDISDYRTSKVLIMGFLSYVIFAIIIKYLFTDSVYYEWFVFIIYWIAFLTIVPIPGSEGFELFRRNNFGWIMTFTILVLALISLLIFSSMWYVILVTVFSAFALMFVFLWRKLM